MKLMYTALLASSLVLAACTSKPMISSNDGPGAASPSDKSYDSPYDEYPKNTTHQNSLRPKKSTCRCGETKKTLRRGLATAPNRTVTPHPSAPPGSSDPAPQQLQPNMPYAPENISVPKSPIDPR